MAVLANTQNKLNGSLVPVVHVRWLQLQMPHCMSMSCGFLSSGLPSKLFASSWVATRGRAQLRTMQRRPGTAAGKAGVSSFLQSSSCQLAQSIHAQQHAAELAAVGQQVGGRYAPRQCACRWQVGNDGQPCRQTAQPKTWGTFERRLQASSCRQQGQSMSCTDRWRSGAAWLQYSLL